MNTKQMTDSNDFAAFAQSRRTNKTVDAPRTIKMEYSDKPGKIVNRQAIERQLKAFYGR